MNEDFSKRVREYPSDPQREAGPTPATMPIVTPADASASTAGTKEQVQQIRFINNPFSQRIVFGNAGSGGF
jgi:hypothetical protein